MANEHSSDNTETYDFILVGAGSAACLLASRLSQQLPDHRILILEAGQHVQNDPKVETPGLSGDLQGNPAYDWDFASQPEPGLNGRRIPHPRGRLAGGTSAINSHSVVFPSYEWQDRIANDLLPKSGKADWSAQGMEDCYERWHTVTSRESDGGSDERIRTSYPHELDELQTHWIKAFEELGHSTTATGFNESSPGAVTITNAIDASKGERSHAATAFLEPALKRGNVTVKTGVSIDNIVFDEIRTSDGKLNAKGVRYTTGGVEHVVSGRDIIVSAGVFGSPAILERSGIGSKEVLAAAKVPGLYELSGVGENLQDHLNCSLSIEVNDDVPTRDNVLRNPDLQRASSMEYERSHTGRLAEGPAYSFAFTPLQLLETPSETGKLDETVQRELSGVISPGLQAQYSFIRQAIASPTEATASTLLLRCQRNRDLESMPKGTPAMVAGNYATVVAMLAHPFSRGSCHITSSASAQYPEIKFNYLSHPLDTEIFARHLRLIERLFHGPTFTSLAKPNGRRLPRSCPKPLETLEEARGILPTNAATNYHPCGTCAMMKEELGGVVDERLRVYGTGNVRICDASILPVIPRGNILAAVYAFAEKAAEIIVRDVKAT
nr:hypothetical protein B0A51_01772 [Rachicladosporium sp. CCFEE 5018]